MFYVYFHTHLKKISYILQINDIQIHDSGIYECQMVANFTTKITQFVELQVRSPPQIIDQHSTLQVNIEEGKDVTLKCYADGYPRPSITWTRDAGGILPAGGKSAEYVLIIYLISKFSVVYIRKIKQDNVGLI